MRQPTMMWALMMAGCLMLGWSGGTLRGQVAQADASVVAVDLPYNWLTEVQGIRKALENLHEDLRAMQRECR